MTLYEADDWILLERLAAPQRIAAAAASGGWDEIVAGLDSVALKYDPDTRPRDAAMQAARALLTAGALPLATPPPPLLVPVCYDAAFGPDQAMVAAALGIAVSALPDWHITQDYTVAMIGFLPGFAYLSGAEPLPEIPRLAQPRKRVERGSIGLLGQQCGVYPLASPGGWPLIGRTPWRTFDPDAAQPFRFAAGQRVRFSAIGRVQFERML